MRKLLLLAVLVAFILPKLHAQCSGKVMHNHNYFRTQTNAVWLVLVNSSTSSNNLGVVLNPDPNFTITAINAPAKWTCNVATKTCTRTNDGASVFEFIQVVGIVNANALSTVTNGATISGGCLGSPLTLSDAVLVYNAAKVVQWGANSFSQLINQPTTPGFAQVVQGFGHVTGLQTDGSIAQWGNTANSQQSNKPTGSGYLEVSSGYNHTIALSGDGHIATWGLNSAGQLNGAPTGNGFIAVSSSQAGGIALTNEGKIVQWGVINATDFPAGNGFVSIAAQYDGGLALTYAGQIVQWGATNLSQRSGLPPGGGWKAIASTSYNGVSQRQDGTLYEWGTTSNNPSSGIPTNSVAAFGSAPFTTASWAMYSDGSIYIWGDAFTVYRNRPTTGGYVVNSTTFGLNGAAALLPLANPSVNGGNNQSANLNTAFATPLSVKVLDGAGNAVQNLDITFTAPGSGASGSFSNGTQSITVPTDASGIASATFTANGTGGSYSVTASYPGLSSASFSLTNYCVSVDWYLDADGDGYYTGTAINACTSPGSGYRSTGLLGGGDCNDDNTAIHPGAAEVCNGIDDNCDGQIDEGSVISPVVIAGGATSFCQGGSVDLTAALGNNAIQLDGINQYLITPDLTSYFSTGSFTIELWFKANSDGVIVSEVGQSTINTNWHDSHIELLPNGHVMVRVWNLAGVDLGTVSPGTWHHAAVRYNAATTTLDGLLDGSPSASNTIGTRQTPSGNGFAQYWAFGAADNSNLGSGKYFNGQLDEIRIWNTAISNAQVAANYNKNIAPNAKGLVAYYKADETTGSIANDATANALHASLANTPTHVIPSGNALNAPSYLWSTTAATPVITAASNGGYYVTAMVSAACQATSGTVNVAILDSVLYVNAAAAAGGNGTSWGTACKYLQDAINTAATNSCVKQVWVAKGTYYPTTDSTGNASPTDNRTKTFFIKNGIAIYGGFAGNELLGYNLSLRDITNNQTILSGDVDGTSDVVSGSGQALTITGNAGNAYHVVFNSQVIGTTVLDGFTVTGGNANGSTSVDRNGGGIYNDNSSLIVNHCIVNGNNASNSGGGFYCNTGNATVNTSLFSRNTGVQGAGIASRSSFTLDHCQLTGNKASSGGGVHFITSGSASFTNCRFTGNYSASSFGGGIFSGRPLTLVSCKIDSNTAAEAGGLAQLNQNLTMTNCTIKNNASIYQTGGIDLQGVPNAILTNCEVSGNTCSGLNGGILNANFGSGSTNPQLSLINCTVANNSSASGYQAVYTYRSSANLKATTILKNTIVAGNPGGNFSVQTPGYLIVQSQGNNLDDDGSSGFTQGVNGDLVHVNPLFKSATDVHLVSCSPAVNAGDNNANNTTLDLDGKPRKVGVIDMGAYENQGVDTSTTNASICPSQLPYSWNGNSYNSGGTYYVHFSSVNGCDSVAALNLTIKAISSSDTTVSVCNKYSWNGINPTVSGTYTWHGTNAAGCDSTATLHLTILFIANTFTKTDAVCYGSATGSIQIQVANSGYVGSPPYSYRVGVAGLINSTTNVFNNLKAGSYRAYVQDANGCIGVAAPVVVGQQPQVTATATPTNTSCYGVADGKISISNLVGYSPFMYKTGTGGTLTPLTLPNTTISNLRAGDYRIYLQDANGCTSPGIVAAVQQPADVVVNYIITPLTCSNPKGSISLSLPGNATGTFKLNPGGNYTSQFLYTGLTTGTYYGYAKNAGGCTGRSTPIVLSPATGCSTFARMASTNANNGKQSFEVSLSPNPSSNRFTLLVHSTKNEAVQLRVMDVNGKVVYTAKGLPEQAFRFGESFANGIYMVEIRQGEEVKTVKAVKMK